MTDLREYFTPFGDVTEVQIPCLENGKKRGFGIVQFASVSSAAAAVKQLNASVFLGKCKSFTVINVLKQKLRFLVHHISWVSE